jgi:hypothetical protein
MMNGKIPLVCALALLALSCGGGGAPKEIPQADACPEASMAICGKIFSCPANDLILGAVQAGLGGSSMNCQTTITQNYCGGFTCSAGQTYHGDKAYQCKEQFSNVACSQISGAVLTAGADIQALITALAPACNQVCTAN